MHPRPGPIGKCGTGSVCMSAGVFMRCCSGYLVRSGMAVNLNCVICEVNFWDAAGFDKERALMFG